MPTNRRFRIRKKRPLTLGRLALRALLDGVCFFEFDDEEHRRQTWEKHRDAILAEWIELHPGTRPWAWWEYDRPDDLRRRIHLPDELLTQFQDTQGVRLERDEAANPGKWYWTKDPPHWGIPQPFGNGSDLFEAESDYLERHGLLTRAERRALEEKGGQG